MIGRLTGILAEKSPPQVLIDVNGVGYEVDVPMSSYFNLPALGERTTLLTHFVVREDAQLLFGFLTQAERATFRQLIKISGVGPRMALGVLSGLSVAELTQAVAQQQAGRLVKVPASARRPPSACCSNSRASSGPTSACQARRWRVKPRPTSSKRWSPWATASAKLLQS